MQAKRTRRSAEERFWEKVDTSAGPLGCWPWTASGSRDGYGQFSADGRGVRAHRFAYELLVGPIPEGLQLDHLCRNPGCVNPAHLEPVTGWENTMRGNTPAAINAAKAYCAKGHPLDEGNTFVETYPDGRFRQRRCLTCRREAQRKHLSSFEVNEIERRAANEERAKIVRLLRAEGAARAGGTAADYWADFIERSAPSPSPPDTPTEEWRVLGDDGQVLRVASVNREWAEGQARGLAARFPEESFRIERRDKGGEWEAVDCPADTPMGSCDPRCGDPRCEAAPSPSPPEPPTPCPACGGSGDRNGNLRASDPFGTCPGCDGRGIREAVSPSPPEPAPDVDAIIERLERKGVIPKSGAFEPFVTVRDAVAAVREAAAPSPPEPDERLETYHVDTFRAEPIAEQGVDGA